MKTLMIIVFMTILTLTVTLGVLISGSVLFSLGYTKIVQTPDYRVDVFGFWSKTYDVRMSPKIGRALNYRQLMGIIEKADSNDKIHIHLMGYGGLADTTVQLINVMKASKAEIITIVEGPVYSAHAFLAVSGDKIIIRPNSVFLFHRSSIYGRTNGVCALRFGTKDRTQDAEQKCLEFYKHVLENDRRLMWRTLSSILTAKEYEKLMKGHDIIIQGDELEKRL